MTSPERMQASRTQSKNLIFFVNVNPCLRRLRGCRDAGVRDYMHMGVGGEYETLTSTQYNTTMLRFGALV